MDGVQLLLVMGAALVIAAISHRKGIQAGVVTVVLGSAASFIPGIPRLEIEPELILGFVVPPLLYSATRNLSFAVFMRNLSSILGLGVGLVVFTTAVVGVVTAWLAPELGIAGALVLAAVVSPPDTVTTISHGRELGLPRKILPILTGESLVNDAAALALFALAVAAVTGDSSFISNPFLLFGYEAGVGFVLGIIVGRLVSVMRSRIGNATLETVFNLLVPFIAYLVAEQLHASGIIAVVAAGFTVTQAGFGGARPESRRAGRPKPRPEPTRKPRPERAERPERPDLTTSFSTRLSEVAVWPVIDVVLEAFVFAYMGLQLRFVLEDLRESGFPIAGTIGLGVAVLLAVILCRFAWVYLGYGRGVLRAFILRKSADNPSDRRDRRNQRSQRARRRPQSPTRPPRHPVELTGKETFLVSWIGMRGIITLAAAGGVPLTIASGEPFPGRTVIQTVAFVVAVGSLLMQGASLPILTKWLGIDLTEEDAAAQQSLLTARAHARAAAAGEPDHRSAHYFDLQRAALANGVATREVDPESARAISHELDLLQAAIEPYADPEAQRVPL